jgi:hypothetical protein
MGNELVVTVEEEKAWETGKRSFLSNLAIVMRRDISSAAESTEFWYLFELYG